MFYDTHCHLDMFDDPISMAKEFESNETKCVMNTMLPSHYRLAQPHIKGFQNVFAALGLHPLRIQEGSKELALFKTISKSAKFIGEIGLDLSTEGKKTKSLQIKCLEQILPLIGPGKFVSVHSRNAHKEMSKLLEKYAVNPVCFHYFIGGADTAAKLSRQGHYFSINQKMLNSRHRSILDVVPKEQILCESDGPFLTKQPISMVKKVYLELSRLWGISHIETQILIEKNFEKCRT